MPLLVCSDAIMQKNKTKGCKQARVFSQCNTTQNTKNLPALWLGKKRGGWEACVKKTDPAEKKEKNDEEFVK